MQLAFCSYFVVDHDDDHDVVDTMQYEGKMCWSRCNTSEEQRIMIAAGDPFFAIWFFLFHQDGRI